MKKPPGWKYLFRAMSTAVIAWNATILPQADMQQAPDTAPQSQDTPAVSAEAAPSIFTDADFSSSDPAWSEIAGSISPAGPIKGTRIGIDNPSVATGAVGDRPFIENFRLHIPTSSSAPYEMRDRFTRWYQESDQTQIYRMFADDENVQSSRPLAARSETFAADKSFDYADNQTNIWSGRFRVADRAGEGFCIFQSKATDSPDPAIHFKKDGWSVQLNITDRGLLVVNERREDDTIVYTQDMNGRSFDAEVRDDGKNYVVLIDGKERASGSYERQPGLLTTFRWGMYFGNNSLEEGRAIMNVSGAQVTTKPGRLS
jgi:hypothetical protein